MSSCEQWSKNVKPYGSAKSHNHLRQVTEMTRNWLQNIFMAWLKRKKKYKTGWAWIAVRGEFFTNSVVFERLRSWVCPIRAQLLWLTGPQTASWIRNSNIALTNYWLHSFESETDVWHLCPHITQFMVNVPYRQSLIEFWSEQAASNSSSSCYRSYFSVSISHC